jgi:hypothetical protein
MNVLNFRIRITDEDKNVSRKLRENVLSPDVCENWASV